MPGEPRFLYRRALLDRASRWDRGPTVQGGLLLVTRESPSPTACRAVLEAFDARTGEPRFAYTPDCVTDEPNEVAVSAAIGAPKGHVLLGYVHEREGAFITVLTSGGEVVATTAGEEGPGGAGDGMFVADPAVRAGHLILSRCKYGKLYRTECRAPDGSVAWESASWLRSVGGDTALIFSIRELGERTLEGRDAVTGRLLWSRSHEHAWVLCTTESTCYLLDSSARDTERNEYEEREHAPAPANYGWQSQVRLVACSMGTGEGRWDFDVGRGSVDCRACESCVAVWPVVRGDAAHIVVLDASGRAIGQGAPARSVVRKGEGLRLIDIDRDWVIWRTGKVILGANVDRPHEPVWRLECPSLASCVGWSPPTLGPSIPAPALGEGLLFLTSEREGGRWIDAYEMPS